MLRLMREIWTTLKAVIMDSGHCVLKLPWKISKRVLWKFIDKKRRYWNNGFHEDAINKYFSTNIGNVVCLSGE